MPCSITIKGEVRLGYNVKTLPDLDGHGRIDTIVLVVLTCTDNRYYSSHTCSYIGMAGS